MEFTNRRNRQIQSLKLNKESILKPYICDSRVIFEKKTKGHRQWGENNLENRYTKASCIKYGSCEIGDIE